MSETSLIWLYCIFHYNHVFKTEMPREHTGCKALICKPKELLAGNIFTTASSLHVISQKHHRGCCICIFHCKSKQLRFFGESILTSSRLPILYVLELVARTMSLHTGNSLVADYVITYMLSLVCTNNVSCGSDSFYTNHRETYLEVRFLPFFFMYMYLNRWPEHAHHIQLIKVCTFNN